MTLERTGFAFIGARLRTNTDLDKLAAKDQPTALLYVDGHISRIGNDEEICAAADLSLIHI